ncbi:MAG: hypothetical protein HC822_21705 [Oscillochloris sp.]|nr:hypothetical protein [Oscillochloris sp.]
MRDTRVSGHSMSSRAEREVGERSARAGGRRITSSLLRVLSGVLDHRRLVQEAVDAPRIHALLSRKVWLERPAESAPLRERLEKRFRRVRLRPMHSLRDGRRPRHRLRSAPASLRRARNRHVDEFTHGQGIARQPRDHSLRPVARPRRECLPTRLLGQNTAPHLLDDAHDAPLVGTAAGDLNRHLGVGISCTLRPTAGPG